MKRLSSIITGIFAVAHPSFAAQVVVGDVGLDLPAGWSIKASSAEHITAVADGLHQQFTLSTLPIASSASMEDFRRLCQQRLAAETSGGVQIFVEQQEPFEVDGVFGLFYSGGDKSTGRIFSGYLRLADRHFVTLYLEGTVAPGVHLETFTALVKALKDIR